MAYTNQQITKKELKELKKQAKLAQQMRSQKVRVLSRVASWLIVGLIVAGGLIGFGRMIELKPDQGSLLGTNVSGQDWVRGNKDSQVVLIEYSDFECPGCAAYSPITKKLLEEFGDKVQFVYRHFPLSNHKNAEVAAYAAEAAGHQGKFWEMHDLIFENQKEWTQVKNARENLLKYAQQLNLDLNQFGADLESQEVKGKVNKDYQSGIQLGIDETPSFFLNGKRIKPQNLDQFRQIIKNEIDKATNSQ